jgi:hypothetical protein
MLVERQLLVQNLCACDLVLLLDEATELQQLRLVLLVLHLHLVAPGRVYLPVLDLRPQELQYIDLVVLELLAIND